MTANFGGTELRNALADVISKRRSSMPTSVIVLTDGEVSDNSELRNWMAALNGFASDLGYR